MAKPRLRRYYHNPIERYFLSLGSSWTPLINDLQRYFDHPDVPHLKEDSKLEDALPLIRKFIKATLAHPNLNPKIILRLDTPDSWVSTFVMLQDYLVYYWCLKITALRYYTNVFNPLMTKTVHVDKYLDEIVGVMGTDMDLPSR
ncbi:hypothetical protein SISNIDRAFT_470337 [Sistotremastrum niveocremeum HHB9708]|uniref:Uncharacterized protein n=1 Tax=Sistotremastrum niveocremeum HHB9708 TaxID=1314777 RepID=A0A164NYH9_9AGAM|nr:hypothetical protein SISNIDRAFT_470337 [Sistotremastrum niveocremeum HHB9708]